jgi:hypothetical protein
MHRTLWALAALAAGAASGGPGVAGGPAGTADVALARAALAAVDADPQLRAATVVVSVVDRVAVVGGPVPSADAARRAEEVVRAVPGVAEVRNRCYVQPGADPLIRPVQDWPSPLPPRRLLADLPGVVSPARPEAAGEPAADAAVAAAPAGQRRVAGKPSAPADNVLLPPVAPGGSVRPATPAPGLLTGRPAGPLDAAEAARRADPRFAGLTLTLADGTLVIGGTAARSSDAWELARQLRTVPGVDRVAVGSVGVE